jgi:hypothetical protein
MRFGASMRFRFLKFVRRFDSSASTLIRGIRFADVALETDGQDLFIEKFGALISVDRRGTTGNAGALAGTSEAN